MYFSDFRKLKMPFFTISTAKVSVRLDYLSHTLNTKVSNVASRYLEHPRYPDIVKFIHVEPTTRRFVNDYDYH